MEQDASNDNSNQSPLSSPNASNASSTSAAVSSTGAASSHPSHDGQDESNHSTQEIPNPRFMPPNESDLHANEIFTVVFVQNEEAGFNSMFNVLFEFQENIDQLEVRRGDALIGINSKVHTYLFC